VTEVLPFLWVCGPSGVGKSSVGWEIFRQRIEEGRPSAYLDFDQIGFCRPAPADDADNVQMSTSNLAVMWPGYRASGARCLVASGIVHTEAEIRSRAAAVPDLAATVCRLRVARDELRRRIMLRGAGGGPPLPGDELKGGAHPSGSSRRRPTRSRKRTTWNAAISAISASTPTG
jgi:hypothetical protein